MGICKFDPCKVLIENLQDQRTFTLHIYHQIHISLILISDKFNLFIIGISNGEIYIYDLLFLDAKKLIYSDPVVFDLENQPIFQDTYLITI